MSRALVLGAGGLLGTELVREAPPSHGATGVSRSEVDITRPDTLRQRIREARPTVVLNAAAFTAVDDAEREPDRAMAVNGTAVGHLGGIASELGIQVVHFSTDYVFDGRARAPYTEDARPNPLNAYGRSKLEGERRLQASGARYLLIRTQWLFGVAGPCFVRTMWERARSGRSATVVSDQVGRATSARDLARTTWALLERGATGCVHVANEGELSMFDLGRAVFAHVGRGSLVTACTRANYPTAAVRPPYSALSTRKLEGLLTRPLPRWERSLRRVLDELDAIGV